MDIEYSLNLHCTSEAQADLLPDAFEPCTDISYGKIPDGGFRRDWELLFEEVNEMDSFRETADDIAACMEDLANADPDASFNARLLILNSSGDGNLVADYSYQGGKLSVQIMETVESVLAECPECGAELDEEIELAKHKHGKKYRCPECGAKFSFEEESYEEEEIEI